MSEPVLRDARPYWFGYLYAAFWAFVTYSCFTHAVVAVRTISALLGSPPRSGLSIELQAQLITTTLLWPLMTLAFAWVSYRLITRKVTMTFIAILVALHATSVLFEGIIPTKLLLFIFLSGIVIPNFRHYFNAQKA
jgi:hypothetical protein